MPRVKKTEVALLPDPRLVAPSSRPKAARRPAAARVGAIAPVPVVTHDQIATRAYEIFLLSGGRHGSDLDHWLQAEQELCRTQSPEPEPLRKRAVLEGQAGPARPHSNATVG